MDIHFLKEISLISAIWRFTINLLSGKKLPHLLVCFYPSLLGWQFCKIWWCDRHFSSCLNKNQEDLAWWNCDLIRYKILDVLNFFIKIIWEMFFFFFIVLKKKYPFQIDNLLRVWLFEIIFSPYSLLMQKNIVALELLRQ